MRSSAPTPARRLQRTSGSSACPDCSSSTDPGVCRPDSSAAHVQLACAARWNSGPGLPESGPSGSPGVAETFVYRQNRVPFVRSGRPRLAGPVRGPLRTAGRCRGHGARRHSRASSRETRTRRPTSPRRSFGGRNGNTRPASNPSGPELRLLGCLWPSGSARSMYPTNARRSVPSSAVRMALTHLGARHRRVGTPLGHMPRVGRDVAHSAPWDPSRASRAAGTGSACAYRASVASGEGGPAASNACASRRAASACGL